MPKAVRKTLVVTPASGFNVGDKIVYPDGSVRVVDTVWSGGVQTGPSMQEMRDAGIVAFEIAPLKGALQLWAKHLNMISGGAVLAFGKKGVKRAFLKQSVDTLRQVADEMEKFL